MTEDIPGFRVPLRRSLTTPIMLAGAPRKITIGIGTIAATIGFGLQQVVPGLAVWLIGQAIAAYLTRKDPQFFQVFFRHMKLPSYFGV